MSRHRSTVATWIACLAVLFNLLAMPISGTMASSPDRSISEQLLRGGFCSASSTKLVVIAIDKQERNTAPNDQHSTMQHCGCCSGTAPLVVLPGHMPRLAGAQLEMGLGRLALHGESPTPRQQWPSLNPRASPAA